MQVRFGSSGIRGRYGEVTTPELALRLGRAVATVADDVVLGRDARTTGPLLADAVAAGLAAQGASVRDVGLQTTPTLAYAARTADAGVEVTASHNPPEDNGFKVFAPDGASVGPKIRSRIEDAVEDPPDPRPWDACGPIETEPGAARAHRRALFDAVGPVEASVVVDGGNGPGGPFTARLLSEAGCDVTTINAHPDGRFPGRPSEPAEEHLADLRNAVKRTGADLGIAHDGDGDRCAAVAADGEVLSGDELLLVFVKHLEPRRVVVPVNTTRALEEAAPDADIVRTRVGDTYVSEELRGGEGGFGGEPSGSWIFPEVSLCPDGPHAALRLARLVEDRPLSDVVPDTYPMHRDSFSCPEDRKTDVVDAFRAEVESLGEITDVDGVRVDLEEGWGLLRPSGTEAKVRLTVEAPSEDTLTSLRSRFETIVRRCLP